MAIGDAFSAVSTPITYYGMGASAMAGMITDMAIALKKLAEFHQVDDALINSLQQIPDFDGEDHAAT